MATLPPTPTPAMATDREPTQPTCQNCQTSTTPLWRRDEMGSVLCNACGLFLKLHGRPRPISLKTDVIKSRNRVKTVRPDMQMKKKQSLPATSADQNGFHTQAHNSASAALAAVQRSVQHKVNGHAGDDNNSPVSRTGTPSMYDMHLPIFQGMDGHQFQSPALAQYPPMTGGSPGRATSPTNGEAHADAQQTPEQLMAANASLKTRVSELEVINELYRGRLTQLEADQQNSDNYRHQAEQALKGEASERAIREDIQRKHDEIQRQLEDSHRRENILKRRLDEMEQEIKDANDKIQKLEAIDSERPAKKPRVDDVKAEAEADSTPEKSSS
ncbi:hypothetical protein BX600DRAFT_505170 [Xylariales sp. PMI_506]|nr:hypothetical protein BX600DRAFT_505170 [Xylariales sp. PMI_506]